VFSPRDGACKLSEVSSSLNSTGKLGYSNFPSVG